MKLVIIRHGDPNYELDALTPRGKIEAELLSRKLVNEPADYYYVSPHGRAKETASYTLEKLGREATQFEWLREFRSFVPHPDYPGHFCIPWDMMPGEWTKDARYYDPEHWTEPEYYRMLGVQKEYDWVCGNFDALLELHGYRRKDGYYEAVQRNSDTLVFFCHFGVTCVLLSHLLGVSPVPLWHGFASAPTSVTTVYTEERQEGIASFRVAAFGDISHLYAGGQEPSFSARFCERFDNENERH